MSFISTRKIILVLLVTNKKTITYSTHITYKFRVQRSKMKYFLVSVHINHWTYNSHVQGIILCFTFKLIKNITFSIAVIYYFNDEFFFLLLEIVLAFDYVSYFKIISKIISEIIFAQREVIFSSRPFLIYSCHHSYEVMNHIVFKTYKAIYSLL